MCANPIFNIFDVMSIYLFFSEQVQTFIHIFEKCNQDWFAVCSVLECIVHQLVQIAPKSQKFFSEAIMPAVITIRL